MQDQDGVTRTLEDYRGKWVILYFYPKDDTPGCTTEACSFRDAFAEYAEKGITVLGVSADTPKSHKKFAAKYHLNFTLLSDPTRETVEAYDAWGPKKLFGREYDGIIRMTYVINPEGEIAKEYPKVTPEGHAGQILEDVAALSA